MMRKSLAAIASIYIVIQLIPSFTLAAEDARIKRNKLISEAKYIDVINLSEKQLENKPLGRNVNNLVNDWARFYSLGKAAQHYKDRSKRNPLYAVVIIDVYGRMGEISKAKSVVSSASRKTDPQLHRIFIEKLYQYALYDQALEWLVVYPELLYAEFFTRYLGRQGKFDEAAKLLEKKMALTSDVTLPIERGGYVAGFIRDIPPVLEYVGLYQRNFRLYELLDRYQEALKTQKGDLALYREYIQVLKEAGLEDREGEFVLELSSNEFQEILNAIRIMEQGHRHDDVIRLCKKALRMEIPEEYLNLRSRGWMAQITGEESKRRIVFDLKISLANAYLAMSSVDEAKAVYEDILQDMGNRYRAYALEKLREMADKSGEKFELDKIVDELTMDKGGVDRFIEIAGLYWTLGDRDRAIEYHRKALDLIIKQGAEDGASKRLNECVRALSMLLKITKKHEELAQLYENVLAHSAEWEVDVESFRYELIRAYEESGKYKEAVDAALAFLSDGKAGSGVLGSTLRQAYRSARKGDLIWDFYREVEKLVEKYPDTPEYSLVWANTYMMDHQLKRALSFYHKLESDPRYAQIFSEMARAYSVRKDYRNAIEYQKKAILFGDNLYDAYGKLAEFCARSMKRAETADACWKMIELTSDSKKLSKAVKNLEKARVKTIVEKRLLERVKAGEAVWKDHALLAEIEKNGQEWQKALEHYRLACEMNPNELFVHVQYARLLVDRKEYEKAIAVYEHCYVIDTYRTDYGIEKVLVSLYERADEVNKAMAFYKRVLSEKPYWDYMMKQFVEYAEEQERLDEVVPFLKKLVENYPKHKEPKEWLEKVRNGLDS